MLLGFLAQAAEVRHPGPIFADPFLGEFARLDVGQDFLHRLARGRSHHPLAARHVAVLASVADRVPHVGDAAFVDQVDDQLDLVQAFEIRHLGRIAGLDQGFVSGADKLGQSAAQHRLLAEQVGFGLFPEAGFDNRGAPAADRRTPRQRHLVSIAGGVLLDRQQTRHAAPLGVFGAHQMARTLGRDHEHVDVRRRHDRLEMDVESVPEGQILARLESRLDLLFVDVGAGFVRYQHHDDVGLSRRLGSLQHAQALGGRLVPRLAVARQSHPHVHPAVAQVERMGMALAAVSDHRNLMGSQRGQVGVAVEKYLHGAISFARRPPLSWTERAIAILPERTISLIPNGRNRLIKPLIFSLSPVSSTVVERGPISTIRPRKAETIESNSERVRSSTATRTITSSRSMVSTSLKSTILITETSLLSCLLICSSTWSSPDVTSTMRDTVGSIGSSLTVSDSML